MPVLERQALLAAIEEVSPIAPGVPSGAPGAITRSDDAGPLMRIRTHDFWKRSCLLTITILPHVCWYVQKHVLSEATYVVLVSVQHELYIRRVDERMYYRNGLL